MSNRYTLSFIDTRQVDEAADRVWYKRFDPWTRVFLKNPKCLRSSSTWNINVVSLCEGSLNNFRVLSSSFFPILTTLQKKKSLFNTNTPQKPRKSYLLNAFWFLKSIFLPLISFGIFSLCFLVIFNKSQIYGKNWR